MKPKIQRSDEQWLQQLSPESYAVCRLAATERPFTGRYAQHFEPGVYHCICCDQPLFGSASKFESGCGWPSFSVPLDPTAVSEREDSSHGMRRVEVLCSACDAHLGHVFPDGPPPGGLRYCINSVSLQFQPAKEDTSRD